MKNGSEISRSEFERLKRDFDSLRREYRKTQKELSQARKEIVGLKKEMDKGTKNRKEISDLISAANKE